MSEKSILGHISNYASAGLVSACVGILTFPIMTRNLSVEDYGIIGLITASTTLAIAFGKLGIQHAIVRFYAESMHNKRGNSLDGFHSTTFTLFTILTLITVVAWLVIGTFVLPAFIETPELPSYFAIASVFIICRMVGSVTWNMLRARQHSTEVRNSTMIGRCTYLALLLTLLATGLINLYCLLVAFVLAEMAAVVYATRAYSPYYSFNYSNFSKPLARRLLLFGLPLMILESLSLVLRLIDRYMIGSVLGEHDLGLYSASYNMSSYIEIVITASLAGALRPMYTNLFETDGIQATRHFLSGALHHYWMLGIPFAIIFVLIAPDLLEFLASHRYGSGVSIIPYIVTVILIDGALIFLSAGTYLMGSTSTLLFWSLVAAVVNMTGNFFVIPRFGIEGAAIVTLCAFLVFCTGFLNRSLRLLMLDISWKKPLAMLLISLVVYHLCQRIDVNAPLQNMLIKGSVSSSILLMVLLVIDRQIRHWFQDHCNKLISRFR